MIEIKNGAVFIDGKQTTNAELIGLALLDYAETIEEDIAFTESGMKELVK